MSSHNRFRVEQQNGVTTLRLVDTELSDLEVQDELHDELIGYVTREKPGKLVIDFRTVQYCNTGIINSLLSTKKRVVAYGGQFKMFGLTKHVHDAFRALNLEGTVFDVHDTEAAALASF